VNPTFSELRALADVLRMSAFTSPALRPFAIELFRPQTDFNHRLVDVLEDSVWPLTADQLDLRLAEGNPEVRNARGGKRGQLIVWTKQAALFGLERALTVPMDSMRRLNRLTLEALKSRGSMPIGESLMGQGTVLEPWFEAQGQFVDAVESFVRGLGPALKSYQAALARFGKSMPRAISEARCRVQLRRPGEPVDPGAEAVLRIPEGETLAEGAAAAVSELFATRPDLQLVYGDTLHTGRGVEALKPGWSPEYDCIGGCYATRLAISEVPLRDLKLLDSQVVRLPWIFSSRASPLAATESRPVLAGTPRVTIIVPFKDKAELLRGLLASLQRFDPGLLYELILVSNQSAQQQTFDYLATLRDGRATWFQWDEAFNWSAINNAAAKRATGDLLLFLNNDIEATHDGWLRDLAAYASQEEIGVAGARLLYPDGSIQHAGVVIGLRGLAGHAFARWRPEYGPTPFGSPEATRNWSAVTGACLMIKRSLFEALGGFDERIRVSGGDVELCLRVRARGLRVVCVGHAVLTHFESMSRRHDGVPPEDVRLEAIAYAPLLKTGDPYWHPRLSLDVGHGGPGPGRPGR